MDPLIDDAIYTAKRLKGLGKPVGLDVLSGLPHGFQFLTQVQNSCQFSLIFHRSTHIFKEFSLIRDISVNRFQKKRTKVIKSVSTDWLNYSILNGMQNIENSEFKSGWKSR